jgi:hypothetical protein
MRSIRRVCTFVCLCPFWLLFQDGTANIVQFCLQRRGGDGGCGADVVCAYESVRHCVCARLCVCVRACVRLLVRVPLCAFECVTLRGQVVRETEPIPKLLTWSVESKGGTTEERRYITHGLRPQPLVAA